jgi:hypothetical protein
MVNRAEPAAATFLLFKFLKNLPFFLLSAKSSVINNSNYRGSGVSGQECRFVADFASPCPDESRNIRDSKLHKKFRKLT